MRLSQGMIPGLLLLAGCAAILPPRETPPAAPMATQNQTDPCIRPVPGLDGHLYRLACRLKEQLGAFDLKERVSVLEGESGQPGACGDYFAGKLHEALFFNRQTVPEAEKIRVTGLYRLENPSQVFLELRIKDRLEPATIEIPREEVNCLGREEQSQGQARIAGFGSPDYARMAARLAARAELLSRTDSAPKSAPPLLSSPPEMTGLFEKLALGVIQHEGSTLKNDNSLAHAVVQGRVHRQPASSRNALSGRFAAGGNLFEAGEVVRFVVRSAHSRPLFLGIYSLDPFDHLLRLYPNADFPGGSLARIVLEPGKELAFPRPAESEPLEFASRDLAEVEEVSALIVVASTAGDFPFEQLAHANDPKGKWTTYPTFMDLLANQTEPYLLTVIPYRIR
ncbi:MAG: hypothetical protein HQL56_03645 [Magnetococcales bacterium]|nr:hypothetical protein [Magnetococcales bacterium]